MDKPNFKIYFILALALGILLILILILSYIRKNREGITPPPEFPTPTSVEFPSNITPTSQLTPPESHPTFTGVLEETLPPDIQALSDQNQALLRKTPLYQPLFNIDFDYGEDKFIVSLNDPKDQARTSFEDWLKDNYPAIPLDRFILN